MFKKSYDEAFFLRLEIKESTSFLSSMNLYQFTTLGVAVWAITLRIVRIVQLLIKIKQRRTYPFRLLYVQNLMLLVGRENNLKQRVYVDEDSEETRLVSADGEIGVKVDLSKVSQ